MAEENNNATENNDTTENTTDNTTKNTSDAASSKTNNDGKQHQQQKQRHLTIWPDYQTKHIWLQPRDPHSKRDEKEPTLLYADLQDLARDLSPSWSPIFDRSYRLWADSYNSSFRARRDQTGDFDHSVFATTDEEVAWIVCGFLLAWKLAKMGGKAVVGSVVYAPVRKEYLLREGVEESEVSLGFLRDMTEVLDRGGAVLK